MPMTKEKLKAAALTLFAEHGYEGTSLAAIAKQVGIKTPSIYAHFQGKEDLFLAVFEEATWEEVQYVRDLLDTVKQSTVEEKLSQIFFETCRFYLHNREKTAFLKRIMLFPPDFLKEPLHEKFIASEDALSNLLRQLFLDGMDAGVVRTEKVESLLASYYCCIDGLVSQMFYYDEAEMAERCQSVWKNFWLGISNVRP